MWGSCPSPSLLELPRLRGAPDPPLACCAAACSSPRPPTARAPARARARARAPARGRPLRCTYRSEAGRGVPAQSAGNTQRGGAACREQGPTFQAGRVSEKVPRERRARGRPSRSFLGERGTHGTARGQKPTTATCTSGPHSAPRDPELEPSEPHREDGALVQPRGTAFAGCSHPGRVLARHPSRDPHVPSGTPRRTGTCPLRTTTDPLDHTQRSQG